MAIKLLYPRVVRREAVREVALQLVGIPYRHLGRDPHIGFDCLGLVMEFFKRLDYPMNDGVAWYLEDWWKTQDLISENAPAEFTSIQDLQILQPLDVVAICGNGSAVPNHLMLVVDDTHVLNVAPRVGVHRLRFFVIWRLLVGAYRRRGLKIL